MVDAEAKRKSITHFLNEEATSAPAATVAERSSKGLCDNREYKPEARARDLRESGKSLARASGLYRKRVESKDPSHF